MNKQIMSPSGWCVLSVKNRSEDGFGICELFAYAQLIEALRRRCWNACDGRRGAGSDVANKIIVVLVIDNFIVFAFPFSQLYD